MEYFFWGGGWRGVGLNSDMDLRTNMSHVKDKSGYVRFQMILCSQQWEGTEVGNVMKFRKDIEQ